MNHKRADREHVVLDIGLPTLNGVHAPARIFEVAPASKVIFLSQQNDPTTIQAVLGLGVSAYVHKREAGSHLLNAITVVLESVGKVAP